MSLIWRSILILLCILPLFSYAEKKELSLHEYLTEQLPEKISKFEPGKTTENEIVKVLGKAAESDHHTLFYEISGVKYDLSIEIENGILHSLVYDLPVNDSKPPPHFSQFKHWINAKKEKEILKKLESQNGHDRGSFFEVNFPEQGISLKFKNYDSKELRQVQITARKTEGKK